MKKYLLTALLAGTLLPVYAIENSDMYKLTEALLNQNKQAQQQTKPASANSHENGVVSVTLNVESQFDEIYARTNHLQKQCAAVRIADNYLLASLACRGVSKTSLHQHYMGSSDKPEITEKPVAYRKTNSVEVKGHKITEIQEDETSKLLLIKLDAEQKKDIKDMPITNLLVAKDPKNLLNLFDEIFINRERVIFAGRTCTKTNVSRVCTDTECFEVCGTAIKGDNGDPIFGLSEKKKYQEFLLGFNDAEPIGDNRKSGTQYHFLSKASLSFLQKNLDTDAWKQVKKKTVDENFFK